MYSLALVVSITIICSINNLVAMNQSPEQFDTLYQLSKKVVNKPTKEKHFTHFLELCSQHSFSRRACDFLIAKEEELRPNPKPNLPDDDAYLTSNASEEFNKTLQYQRVRSMIEAIQGNTIN